MNEIIEKVKELSEINARIVELNERKKELEVYFYERGSMDVADTKYKSCTYADENSQASVTYTQSQTLKISKAKYLKKELGKEVFQDIFKEEIKHEIKPKDKDIERMLIGIFSNNFFKQTPKEIIDQLPCDDKAKAVLSKKLKGANFDTDRDNLIKIGGLSQNDASDYAYMYAESVVWQTFCRVAEMSGANKESVMKSIKLGVDVSDSAKLSVT